MNIYIKIFLGVAVVGAITMLCFLSVAARLAKAVTDKTEYWAGATAEVTINNDTGKPVCFSSCYPYFLEIQVGDKWQKYSYGACDEGQIAVSCMKAGELKKFQLTLAEAVSGVHRLNIQICSGCAAGQKFKADSTVISNTFTVQATN